MKIYSANYRLKTVRHRRIKILFVFSIFILNVTYVFGQSSSIKEILKNSNLFNGKTVEIQGEVIGEPLKDADTQGIWINITFQGSNIGIFCSHEESIVQISHWGSYKEKGDQLKIRGVFYKDCPEHQISGVHLKSLEVMQEGGAREDPVSLRKKKLAIGLFAICLTIGVIYSIKRKYARKT